MNRAVNLLIPSLMVLGLGVPGMVLAQPEVILRDGEQMRVDLVGSGVHQVADGWRVVLRMSNDNDFPEGVLPSSFRRWWHAEVGGLNTETGERLHVEVTNAGYSTTILPTWSLDNGETWTRIPESSMPVWDSSTSTHRFTIDVPPDVPQVLLAKWYPYTPAMFEAYRQGRLLPHPMVNEVEIGRSEQDRPIYQYIITDASVPTGNKARVWVHNCVHPAENPGYFMVEGLVDWLLGDSREARAVLQQTIFCIVPVANPDGQYLGNYRTNANGVNLENQWTAPYNTQVAEVKALRERIEEFMGEPSNPGESPIRILLNVHAAHGSGAPFHFVHRPLYDANGTGVTEEVYQLEVKWVDFLRERSPFMNRGSDNWSVLAGRPFVESMMHDRYTIHPSETWDPVMAITIEGTYQAGPTPGSIATQHDYRELGEAIGWAVSDFLELDLEALRTSLSGGMAY
ncbi:MAG: hypothetical protein JJU11_01275 [Candidatus Sumerlaeia bacterium]|nr:hypothetical protein [Candidatus Sumerlaeia bacterium]